MPQDTGSSPSASDGPDAPPGTIYGRRVGRGLRHSEPHGLGAFATDATVRFFEKRERGAECLLPDRGNPSGEHHGLHRGPVRRQERVSFFRSIYRNIETYLYLQSTFTKTKFQAKEKNMSITVIKPQELIELCKKGKKIDLIDVRTPVEYREVHVEFARNVPLDQLDAAELMQTRKRSAGESLYVICHSGGRGQQACEILLKAGFSNVFNIEGGTIACVEAGLPIVRGKKAIS